MTDSHSFPNLLHLQGRAADEVYHRYLQESSMSETRRELVETVIAARESNKNLLWAAEQLNEELRVACSDRGAAREELNKQVCKLDHELAIARAALAKAVQDGHAHRIRAEAAEDALAAARNEIARVKRANEHWHERVRALKEGREEKT